VSKRSDLILGLSIVFITIFLIMLLITFISQKQRFEGVSITSGGNNIAVIELNGIMYDSKRVVRQFKRFGENKSIKAIVFRINSPGGVIVVAQEIFEEVRRVRDSGKPIVASLASVAASGGYYVACAADTIIANPGTTTGSIGVIAEIVNVREALEKIGIKVEVIKSGRFKDTGSPYRDMTQAEKSYLQSWINDAYIQFVDVVARERNLSRKRVMQLADGRVFTGKQAKKYGLVDLLGDYDLAINVAAKMAGITGKPNIIKERQSRVTLFDLLFQKIEGMLRASDGLTIQYRLIY